jgi:hypothetical protein
LITCYAEPTKKKSRLVLEAFAAGCGGRMASTTARELEPGSAAFYGVREGWAHLWEQAKAERRDVWYLDNSYFDCAREKQFRATLNAIQHTGEGDSDGSRLKALGIEVKPRREGGKHIVACQQSDEFMRVVGEGVDWLRKAVAATFLEAYPVVYRSKGETRPLLEDLKHARALITWSSTAAVTALLEGVPVKCSVQCCACHAGKDRARWAAVLAGQQWTLDEMAAGMAWKA